LKGEVSRNLEIFGEEGDTTVAEVEEEEVGVDFECVRDGKTFLDSGEDVDVDELDFSLGMINDTEDSFFKKDNGISLCLRLVAEFKIRGGGIVGIGDLVDKVLK